MENFKQLFLDEAAEFLSKLEETLLQLEEDLGNEELINEVFRIMHSLKGSGAMFGYDNLSNLTHDLETLYDKIRSGQLSLSTEIISFSMQSADHINNLLNDDDNTELVEISENIKSTIRSLIANDKAEIDQLEVKKLPLEPKTKSNTSIYYIKFVPNEEILSDGTNPLYLIDELADLGDHVIQIITDDLPSFDELDPELINISWILILSTENKIDEIKDVFIFVEDDSELEIIKLSETDIFSLPNCKTTLQNALLQKENSPNELVKIIKNLEGQLSSMSNAQQVIEEKQVLKRDPNNIEQTKSQPDNFIPAPVKITTVNVSSKKLDTLINLVSELVTTQARLASTAYERKSTELDQISEDLQLLTRQFRDIAFEMRLIPVHTLIVKFRRLVRDLSNELNKKVKLTTEGTETEMDKSIISTISDPIMHIIRNSIDHGIEPPDIRIKNDKKEAGTIHFKAYSEGTSIVLSISDDGCGINKQKVFKKAVEKGLINSNDELNDNEINSLIMQPGFSTSERVTDVSGRGVGMDVVRKKIEELRGEVKIISEEGQGTEIIIRLPLTLSIIDGLLVTINKDNFIIPLSDVVQIYQTNHKKLASVQNNIIDIEGVQYSFLNLPTLFHENQEIDNIVNLITVKYNEKTVGLVVNRLVSEYQAVLKPINRVIKSNDIFAGATILGDGSVAMVLDIHKLIDYYSNKKLELYDNGKA